MNIDETEKELHNMRIILFKIALSNLKNREDAEDAVLETEYIVIKEINKLKNKDKFKQWVISILYNECKKFYRESKKDRKILQNNMEMLDYTLDDLNSKNNFEDLIKELNDEEKTIFRLYFYDNLTLDEIAKKLNMNKNTLKSKYRRGKEKIKRMLLISGIIPIILIIRITTYVINSENNRVELKLKNDDIYIKPSINTDDIKKEKTTRGINNNIENTVLDEEISNNIIE